MLRLAFDTRYLGGACAPEGDEHGGAEGRVVRSSGRGLRRDARARVLAARGAGFGRAHHDGAQRRRKGVFGACSGGGRVDARGPSGCSRRWGREPQSRGRRPRIAAARSAAVLGVVSLAGARAAVDCSHILWERERAALSAEQGHPSSRTFSRGPDALHAHQPTISSLETP